MVNDPAEPTLLRVELPNNHLIWIDRYKEEEFLEKMIALLKEYAI
jgi:hypothetical protein